MAFCEFSSEVINKNSVNIENAFITDFMPYADDNCIKVYLYGLFLCGVSKDNTIEAFEKTLNLTRDDIISIFYYWQEKGLVQVINVDQALVRYLPVKNALKKLKKYNVDKYTAFNISAQELIGSKMLTPREFEEFYYLIENLHLEKEAVLKIISYCVQQKGTNVSVNYIVAVAKNWAFDGVKTSQDVDDRITDQERVSSDVILVMKALGYKRQATTEEYQLFLNWKNELELQNDIILAIAKKSKVKSFEKLNEVIQKCYVLRLESLKEINDYFDSRDKMFEIAKKVVKNLGLWYQDLSVVVDTYITNWLTLGFDEDAIVKLSNYAFKSSIRTLEGLNNNLINMYKVGILTSEAIDNYLDDIVKNDIEIANILNKLGIVRNVNSNDRMFYKTWLYEWKLNENIINYAIDLSKDKYMPMQYLNKILSEYHNSGVTTIDDAKKIIITNKSTISQEQKNATKREYTKKELDSLFDNISEIEI